MKTHYDMMIVKRSLIVSQIGTIFCYKCRNYAIKYLSVWQFDLEITMKIWL